MGPHKHPRIQSGLIGGKIHSDLERGFIRAETVAFDDLDASGSFKTARERGVLRIEGKDYTVRDGDVLTIRFSV